MREILRENKLAAVFLAVSFAAAVGAGAVFFVTGGDNLLLFIAQIACFVWFLIQLRVFIKILRRYGIENPVTARVKRFFKWIFDGIFAFFVFISEKLSQLAVKLPRVKLPATVRRKRSRLTVFHDEKTRMRRKRDPFHKMKWKNLQTHRERVRFIYISFLKGRIKKGAVVQPHETPNELAEKLGYGAATAPEARSPEAALFPLYNAARYAADGAVIEKEDVEGVLSCATKRLHL